MLCVPSVMSWCGRRERGVPGLPGKSEVVLLKLVYRWRMAKLFRRYIPCE